MELIGKTVAGLYGLGIVICTILLIYLVVRRIRLKKKEDFEQRDN